MAGSTHLPIQIRNTLSRLKGRGCNILVVGKPSEKAFMAYSRLALGNPASTPARVLGLTKLSGDPDQWLPSGVSLSDDRTAAVALPGTLRGGTDIVSSNGTASSSLGPELPAGPETPAGPDAPPTADGSVEQFPSDPNPSNAELRALGLHVTEDIDEFEDALLTQLDDCCSDSGVPDVRLTVSSLSTLFQRSDEERVRAFVEALSSRVLDERGMGFYHVPKRLDSEDVQALKECFDAVVVLRRIDDGRPRIQQRILIRAQTGITQQQVVTPWADIPPR